jgi:hypothetical protein
MSGNLHFQLKKISLNTVRYMLYNDDFDYVHPLNPGLGYGVLAVLGQPAECVFVWVVLVALLFAGINGVTMFMIGKGSMRAVRIHLALAVISLVLTAAYLLAALIGSPFPGVSLTAALVSIVMLLLSGSAILSTAFYKMLLFTLHNRAWRKLIRQTRDAHMPR